MATVKDVRDIQFETLEHVDNIEAQLRGEVLTKAHQLFGYCADSFAAAGPLAKALVALDIKPLKAQQVEDYMRSKEGTKNFHTGWIGIPFGWLMLPLWLLFSVHLGCFSDRGNDPTAAFSGIVVVFLLVLNLWQSFERPWPKYRRTTLWTKYTLGKAAQVKKNAMAVYKSAMEAAYRMGNMEVNWSGDEAYPRYIPVHVLNMCVQVKELVPDAQFYVHELTSVVERMTRPKPDPFIEVQLGSERYWLAVWDEREFEAKA